MHSRNPQPWWPVPWTPAQKEPSNCGSPGAQPSPANQKKRPRQHQLKSCKTPKQQSPQIPVAMNPSLRLTEEAVLILTIPQITQLPNPDKLNPKTQIVLVLDRHPNERQ